MEKIVVGAENVKKVATGTKHVNTYVPKTRGYPTEPGQTWHDLTPQQRAAWFQEHENRWKRKFTQEGVTNGMGSSLNLSRG